MKITIDGVEIDAQKLIDQGWTPPKEPEPEVTENHVGCAVEVSDYGSSSIWYRITLSEIDTSSEWPYVGFPGGAWKYARLIREPQPVAMIPWSGGECPVDEGTPTVVVCRDDVKAFLTQPEGYSWSHEMGKRTDIIAYLPLDLRMPGGER